MLAIDLTTQALLTMAFHFKHLVLFPPAIALTFRRGKANSVQAVFTRELAFSVTACTFDLRTDFKLFIVAIRRRFDVIFDGIMCL